MVLAEDHLCDTEVISLGIDAKIKEEAFMASSENMAACTSLCYARRMRCGPHNLLKLDDSGLQNRQPQQTSMVHGTNHCSQSMGRSIKFEIISMCYIHDTWLLQEGCWDTTLASMPATSSGICLALICPMATCMRDQALTSPPPEGMTREQRPLFFLCKSKGPLMTSL